MRGTQVADAVGPDQPIEWCTATPTGLSMTTIESSSVQHGAS